MDKGGKQKGTTPHVLPAPFMRKPAGRVGEEGGEEGPTLKRDYNREEREAKEAIRR